MLEVASPDELAAAQVRPTLEPSLQIESFEGDWEKEWFTYRPAEWARTTHKLADESRKAPDNAMLELDVQAAEANELVVVIDDHAAAVQLDGGAEWQHVVLAANDLRNVAGQSLASWANVRRLKLCATEKLKPSRGDATAPRDVGKSWNGADPQFRNLRWSER